MLAPIDDFTLFDRLWEGATSEELVSEVERECDREYQLFLNATVHSLEEEVANFRAFNERILRQLSTNDDDFEPSQRMIEILSQTVLQADGLTERMQEAVKEDRVALSEIQKGTASLIQSLFQLTHLIKIEAENGDEWEEKLVEIGDRISHSIAEEFSESKIHFISSKTLRYHIRMKASDMSNFCQMDLENPSIKEIIAKLKVLGAKTQDSLT